MRAMICALLLAAAPAQASYHLDSSNTQVSFSVQRLGIQWVSARFSDISGVLVVDHRSASGHVEVSVGLASLSCSDARWNERLRSPEWLDVQHFPLMSFQSGEIDLHSPQIIAPGLLTLHGITRRVVLHVSSLSCNTGELCQFTARAHIRRSEYGLPHSLWTGGDAVDIAITGALANAAPNEPN